MHPFIGGQQSVEVKKVGLAMTQQVTQGRMQMIEGTHLFPIENPLGTASAIEAALAAMGAKLSLGRPGH